MIEFFKMHAQGNSYIYLDYTQKQEISADWEQLAIQVSDKNIGLGGDGLVLLTKIKNGDTAILMRIWNKDGSEAEICGSALRCSTALLSLLYQKKEWIIETKAGRVKGTLLNDEQQFVSVDLSNVSSNSEQKYEVETLEGWKGINVNVGNRHFVIFNTLQDNKTIDFQLKEDNTSGLVEQVGSRIEQQITNGANVEIVEVIKRDEVRAFVWEMGSGQTLACGTGAIAITKAGSELGILEKKVNVVYPGGVVTVDTNNKKITLEGVVTFICKGVLYQND